MINELLDGHQHLERGEANWLATQAMRDELKRVLAYAHIESRLGLCRLQAGDVLTRFDRHARIVEAPAKAPVTCKDPDDQMFIDLAVAHRCMLLSKDAAVLSMTKRLAQFEVLAAPILPSSSYSLIGS